jgi:membrane protease YdiL (CAAX protease family)
LSSGFYLDYTIYVTIFYLTLGGIAILFASLLGNPLSQTFPLFKPNKKHVIATIFTYIAASCFTVITNIIVSLFSPAMLEEHSEVVTATSTSLSLFPSLFAIAVLPAIFEEVVFRGAVLQSLKTTNRIWLYLPLSAIMFGAMHGVNLQIIYAAVLGLGLGYIMIRTGNLLYPIACHFWTNGLSVLLLHWISAIDFGEVGVDVETNQIEAAAENLSLTAFYSGFAMILFGVGVLCLYAGVRRYNDKSLDEVDRVFRRRVQIFAFIALGLGFIVFMTSCAKLVSDVIQNMDLSDFT